MKNNRQKAFEDDFVKTFYSYMDANYRGITHSVTRDVLADEIGVSTRDLRLLIKEVNENPEYQGLISTSYHCYLCANPAENKKVIISNYMKGLDFMKKALEMERKVGNTEKIELWLGDDYDEIVSRLSNKGKK